MLEYMSENNWIYFVLVAGGLYLAYGYIKGGGVGVMLGRHVSKIKGLFSSSRK